VTFVSAILNRKSRNMTKIKTQKKRGKNYTFIPIDEDEITDVSQSPELQNLAIDVSKVIETLPATFKTLCKTLKYHNVQETAEILGKSKSYIYGRIAVLRKLLVRLSDYFNCRRSAGASMTLKITKMQEISSADRSVKMVIFGSFGIGKTSLLKTFEEPTLCLDFEAGLLSVQDWNGGVLAVQTWEEVRDLACLICGPNPAVRADKFYSKRHYEYCLKKYGFAEDLKRYKCIFIDSVTVALRLHHFQLGQILLME
jgi:hypothetical protein